MKNMIVIAQAEHARAEQRRPGQLERRIGKRLQARHQCRFPLAFGQAGKVLGGKQVQLDMRRDDLLDVVAVATEGGAQDRLALHQGLQG
jgi:hypothetical protein